MAGVDTSGPGTGKRKVDQEINMIPFIDLLMVTISFLLITAVWSSLARMDASAQVPSPGAPSPKVVKKDPWVLHVRASEKDKAFLLQWQHGNKTEDLGSVAMSLDASNRYRALEEAVSRAYQTGLASGRLQGDDLGHEASATEPLAPNTAVLHTDNAVPFGELTRIMDAVSAPRRAVCMAPRPECCGRANGHGASPDGCRHPASDVPAFAVVFAAS